MPVDAIGVIGLALKELGEPTPDYPANIANAARILRNFLAAESDGSYYQMHCIACGSPENLVMVPHRRAGNMVGWVFVCLNCFPKVAGVRLDIQIIRREGDGP